jgi:uncharacterized membrane protein
MGENRKPVRSRNVALAAVLAALYAAGVYFFAPISFAVVQVRVADALLPLSILFGPPAVVGLGIGVFIGNFANPFSLGPIDVVGGTIANVVATALAWFICKRKFRGSRIAAVAAEILVITMVVGTYLAYLTSTPLVVSWSYVAAGEVIAVGVGGYALLRAITRVMGGKQV